MQRCLLLFTITLILAAVGASSGAEDASAVRRIIQDGYDRMSAAAARRDIDGWFALKTPDFVSVAKNGQETSLAGKRGAMNLVMTMVRRVESRVRVDSCRLVSPSEALARIREHTVMTVNRLNGQTATMVVDTVAEATWVRTPAGWREKRSRSLDERGTLDGKPLQPPPSK